MWTVFNEYGPVEDFDNREDAEAFADRANERDPESHWVLFVYYV